MNNKDIYVSLDIGTSGVRVIIGEMSGGSLKVVGVGSAPSTGLKKGAIVDIDETVRSIKQAVDQAERMVGLQIEQVILGVNGNHIDMQECSGVVAVSSPDREIRTEDIDRVMDAAQVLSIPPEREVIDVIPNQFIVDGLEGISDPRGMLGVRLELEGIIITGAKTALHNLLRCVEKAGLEVADICLQPLAAGTVALSRDEKALGVALVDIGGGSTTVSVFRNGVMQSMSVLPIGGDHVTNDISVGIRTTTEEAERVKREHGHAFIDEASDEVTFEVQTIGSEESEEYSQYEIAHIIEPRFEEILELVDNEIYKMGFSDLPGGYILTGGSVMVPGALELARDVLRHNVRMAVPDYIGVREPIYTTGIGLIEFAHRNVKIQGKEAAASVSSQNKESEEEPQQPAPKKEQQKDPDNPGMKKKMKNFFKVFFE
ncbi:cell division protein FtsA [Alteribacillus persepolensis]|uniref:Cell division protein FtsA n=1 Tax=Alteribacillus persepolensis TaxID=568899 RepID=A0A1G7YG93_9BACI|nr:cell division protein FtsA [Alteribacillus persepolensis]SDG95315.1 cell division protein FtsA [Alteribacillus persepolensis]